MGYDDAVAETARLTESRPELDEQEQRAINERLAYIADHIHEQPEVRIKYFILDEHKSGGAIVEASGKVKKISATGAWQMNCYIKKINHCLVQSPKNIIFCSKNDLTLCCGGVSYGKRRKGL